MAADADQDDVLLPQLQLKGDAIVQVDRYRVQAPQASLQRVESQRGVEGIVLQEGQCAVVSWGGIYNPILSFRKSCFPLRRQPLLASHNQR